MNAQQFLLVVWARRRLVLIVFALSFAIGTTVTLLLPKQYIASVSIVVDVKSDPIAGMVLPAVASPSYLATQMQIIQSERVASRVVKMLQLEKSAPALAAWKESTDGKLPFEHFYGKLLLNGVAVRPAPGSNIIIISFAGLDPEFSAAVVNAFAQAYIDTSIDLRVEPARQYAAWFDERLKNLRGNLEKAQARLSAFQQEKGIVAADARLDQEVARLVALGGQLSGVQGQKVETETRQKNTGSEFSPDVLQNPLIQGLKSSLAQAEAKLSEISSVVDTNHPQWQALEAQIAGLKLQLKNEIRRISGGAATANRVSNQQERELKALVEAQKRKVLELRSEHDGIAVLVQDVETAQRAYEAVAKRVTDLSLESKSEQTNLSVLSPAVAPSEPAKPKVLHNILAAFVGGLALGMAMAFAVESLDRHVRNVDDLVVDGIAVLGTLRAESGRASLRQRLGAFWCQLPTWRQLPPWRRRASPLGAG